MNQRHLYPLTLAATTLLLMSAAAAQTAAAVRRPGPPPQLCVNNICSSAVRDSSVSAAAVKWHPGHYVLAGGRYTPAGAATLQAKWSAALSSDSRLAGVNGFYDWYHLEPTTQGVYDFTSIDNDIAWLKANFPGKKLLIEVWTRNFCGSTSLPTLPQPTNNGCTDIPDYIVSGAFTGSGGVSGATWNSNGLLAAFWSAPVLARIQALDAALAARYDGNPTVEAIKYDEFSPPGPSAGAPTLGWSNAAAQTAWKTLHTSMASNWPHTNKAIYANYPRDANGAADFGLISYLQSIKVGVGGPDTLPLSGSESWGAQIVRGAGGGFGTTDYRGAIPLIWEAENPNWPFTAPQMETYAYETLQATHITWLYNPLNYDGTYTAGKGTTPWVTASPNANGHVGVLDTLQSNGFRIHAGCPTVYNGNCNTN